MNPFRREDACPSDLALATPGPRRSLRRRFYPSLERAGEPCSRASVDLRRRAQCVRRRRLPRNERMKRRCRSSTLATWAASAPASTTRCAPSRAARTVASVSGSCRCRWLTTMCTDRNLPPAGVHCSRDIQSPHESASLSSARSASIAARSESSRETSRWISEAKIESDSTLRPGAARLRPVDHSPLK
jgi:hypothetical protein